MSAAQSVAQIMQDHTVMVIKSTVPVGTAQKLRHFVGQHTQKSFSIVSNPEFLREGTAVEDFLKPDRVVIGHHENEIKAAQLIANIYAPLVAEGYPLYFMNNASAELAKYASNCFLATKISFINSIAELCEELGADIGEVAQVMKSDPRIGTQFLSPGLGYGGSCFSKDVNALLHTAKKLEWISILSKVQSLPTNGKSYGLSLISRDNGMTSREKPLPSGESPSNPTRMTFAKPRLWPLQKACSPREDESISMTLLQRIISSKPWGLITAYPPTTVCMPVSKVQRP